MFERYYAGPIRFGAGDELVLSPDESHHVLKVLRAQPGAQVRVFGDGVEASAVLVSTANRQAAVRIQALLEIPAKPDVEMHFAVPWIKGGKTELVVQKLTELGASALIVYSATREVAKGDLGKLERLARVALEACKQCERCSLPKIVHAGSLKEALESSGIPISQRIVLYERERSAAFDKVLNSALAAAKERCVLIASGPEGGFAPEELAACEGMATLAGFGPLILRAETAPVAAAAAILALTGNL